jgi:hypothetical protein
MVRRRQRGLEAIGDEGMKTVTAGMLAAGVLAAAACSGSANAATLTVGEGKQYAMPSAAIAAASAGDVIEIYPGQYFDCAVVNKDRLTITGVGDGAVMTDKTCMKKAILVINGGDITIRNLTLTRARVPDQNGAAIRAQGTNLTLDHVNVINNEDGILASDNPESTIRILNSVFEKNGKCANACAHGIYINRIKLLHVENSRFFDTHQGHSIKSLAARTEIIGTTIEDGPDGTSSYAVDIPKGGALLMANDTIEKGPKAENHSTSVTIGEEGVIQPTPEIVIRNSTFTNNYDGQTTFVRNMTATEARITGVKFRGNKTKPLEGDGSVS